MPKKKSPQTTDDAVMAAVEKALAKNPDASVDELYDMATKVDAGVAQLSKRQFHARYPLQVKRKMAPPARRSRTSGGGKKTGRKAAGAGKGGSKAKGGGKANSAGKAVAPKRVARRDGVREILLEFAAELAGAEERKDAVRVVAGVDRWVDRVLDTTG